MDWAVFGGVLGTVLAFIAGIFTSLRTARSTKEANAITFSRDLMLRVESLEKKDEEKDRKIEELGSIMSVSLSFIERLFHWGRGGGGQPEPTVPAQLRDRLAHLINDHREG
ncbi:hypothetical protein CRM73_00085 [Kocuria sp. CCUG 69068]|uniref:hypothetical protein n=1 Tax=Kocuria sp. CCUG 69068 TaxID=2043138 RepID=UPI001E43810F|nr:hypothetical protein [Kocuria sp. CCUG 69068]